MSDDMFLVFLVIIVLLVFLILVAAVKYQKELKRKKKKKIRKKHEESANEFDLRESIDRFNLNVNRFNSLLREYPKEAEYFRTTSIEKQNGDALDYYNENIKAFEEAVLNGHVAADKCNSDIDHQLYQSFMDSEEVFSDAVEQMQMLFSGLKDYVVNEKTVHADFGTGKTERKSDNFGRVLNFNTASGYFAGCDSAESLEKRFKALCKVYHPDNTNGDSETFKALTEEYKSMKKMMEEQKS